MQKCFPYVVKTYRTFEVRKKNIKHGHDLFNYLLHQDIHTVLTYR